MAEQRKRRDVICIYGATHSGHSRLLDILCYLLDQYSAYTYNDLLMDMHQEEEHSHINPFEAVSLTKTLRGITSRTLEATQVKFAHQDSIKNLFKRISASKSISIEELCSICKINSVKKWLANALDMVSCEYRGSLDLQHNHNRFPLDRHCESILAPHIPCMVVFSEPRIRMKSLRTCARFRRRSVHLVNLTT